MALSEWGLSLQLQVWLDPNVLRKARQQMQLVAMDICVYLVEQTQTMMQIRHAKTSGGISKCCWRQL